MVRITGLESTRARAAAAGIRAGDTLLSINGNEIADVLDYRFYLADEHLTLSLLRDGAPLTVTIDKEIYDDIGLLFETPLMDRKKCCANRCVFCFIDQLPKGLRPSLYFKDDDARLSFLHGNYITLTNLYDKDIDRIIKMHISPVNVSVHTTNPALRCEMMGNRRAGEVLSYLKKLARGGIDLRLQIVLCRGINDGKELSRSMRELAALHPAVTSVSIVPAGLTRYREGLFPLTPFTPEECRAVIRQVNDYGEHCRRKTGNRIFCCADEFYLKAGMPLPPEEYYGEYEQLENGVGMIRATEEDFVRELPFVEEYFPQPVPVRRRVTLATGKAATALMRRLAARLTARVPWLTVDICEIENRFFGPEITVSGLLTGKDIAEQLSGKDLGDALLLPANTLRAERDLFLCGMTPAELSEKLSVPLLFTGDDAPSLLHNLLGSDTADTPK